MLEVQAVTPTYPIVKAKKIHKDEYRASNKQPRNKRRLEENEEKQDDAPPNQHIDERV